MSRSPKQPNKSRPGKESGSPPKQGKVAQELANQEQANKREDFAEMMLADGVQPLSSSGKQHFKKSPKQTAKVAAAKRQTPAVDTAPSKHLHSRQTASDTVEKWLGPHDIVSFRRADGLQHKRFKEFKQGKIRPALTLDLHRCTVAEAREHVVSFAEECHRENIRCALILHGKGFHSRNRQDPGSATLYQSGDIAKIKSYTVHWLQQMPDVIAIHSAMPRDGGTGALYVLFTSHD